MLQHDKGNDNENNLTVKETLTIYQSRSSINSETTNSVIFIDRW